MSDNQPLELNISKLLQELGLGDADEETKKEISEMFQSVVDAKLKLFLMESVTEEEAKKIDSMSEDETIKFFEEEKGINFDATIVALAEESMQEMLEDAAYIQGQIDADMGSE